MTHVVAVAIIFATAAVGETGLEGCGPLGFLREPDALSKLYVGDSDTEALKLLGAPSTTRTVGDTTSSFYGGWTPRWGVWHYDACSFRVDIRAGRVTSIERLT